MLATPDGQSVRARARPPTAGASQLDSPVIASLVDTESAFLALRDQWNRLALETDPTCVFLRHEWFDAAWQWARDDGELAIVRIDRGESLIGICPLIRRLRRRGGLMVRTLELLAVPDTQRCELLAAPAEQGAVTHALADALARPVVQWDIAELGWLIETSPLVTIAPGCFETRRCGALLARDTSNPSVDLTQGWETYYRGRRRGLKKNNSLVANRLARAGGAAVEYVCSPLNPEQLEHCLDRVVALSASSWKHTTGMTLDQPGPQRFLRHIARVAAQNGWLSVWFLSVDGRSCAMEFQLRYAGQVHALRSDFDDGVKALSPGSYLNWKLLEGLFQTGATRYHMGPGDNGYKRLWAEQHTPVYVATIYNRTLVGYMLRTLDRRVRPLIRRWAGASRPS